MSLIQITLSLNVQRQTRIFNKGKYIQKKKKKNTKNGKTGGGKKEESKKKKKKAMTQNQKKM